MFEITIHVHFPDAGNPKLDRIIQLLTNQGAKMSQLQQRIDELTAQVAENTTVEKSALALISGFGGQLAAAILAAQEAGASAAQLDALTGLKNALGAADTELAAAVAANIAPVGTEPPPVVP